VIRELREDDWPAVRAIYEQGIATANATFETAAPTWPEWDASHDAQHRLVAEENGRVVGWTAAAPISRRPCYAGVAAESVYVDENVRGRGVGRSLLDALLARTDGGDIWTVETSIFPENAASIALHLRCGFRIVGRRERISQLHGVWRDTVLMERRRT
jgi:phosphinothricin acetyltransferase